LGAIVERQVRHRIRATSLPAPDYADRSRAHQNDIAGTVPAVREMGAVTRANCDIALRLAPKHTRAETTCIVRGTQRAQRRSASDSLWKSRDGATPMWHEIPARPNR